MKDVLQFDIKHPQYVAYITNCGVQQDCIYY